MPVGIVFVILAVLFFRSPIAKAIADNMRAHGTGPIDPGVARQVEALRAELQDVRADVAELAERLDFTERMLADVRRRDALPG